MFALKMNPIGFTDKEDTERVMKVLPKFNRKYRMLLKHIYGLLLKNRHRYVDTLISSINQKLRGNYGYYGIIYNTKGIYAYY